VKHKKKKKKKKNHKPAFQQKIGNATQYTPTKKTAIKRNEKEAHMFTYSKPLIIIGINTLYHIKEAYVMHFLYYINIHSFDQDNGKL